MDTEDRTGPADLADALRLHALWLKGDPLGSRLDLSGRDLAGVDLRAQDLTGADLSGANLTDACLWDANLTNADLTDTRGLLPSGHRRASPLSGANLRGAKLPAPVANWDAALANVTELSKTAGTLFVAMVSACVFLLMILNDTQIVHLLFGSALIKLPVFDAQVPITDLYWIGPSVVFTLYLLFQFNLQRLWEILSDLPAVFPDGTLLTRKTYPWMINDLVALGYPVLLGSLALVSRVELLAVYLLSYFLVPAGFSRFADQYARLCEPHIAACHYWWMAAFALAIVGSQVRAIITCFRIGSRRPSARVVGAIAFALVCSAIWAVPTWRAIHSSDARKADFLRNAEISTKPDAWVDDGNSARVISEVRQPADLAHAAIHLNGYDLTGAFLVGAKINGLNTGETPNILTNADLRGANLSDSDFGGANLDRAQLSRAILDRANFRGYPRTSMRHAHLEEASLIGADFSGAHMEYADLEGAILYDSSKLDDCDLARTSGDLCHPNSVTFFQTSLDNALLDNLDFTGVDLSGAFLTKADLRDSRFKWAHLDGAHLEGAHLEGADLSEAVLDQNTDTGTGAFADKKTIWPERIDLAEFQKRYPRFKVVLTEEPEAVAAKLRIAAADPKRPN